MSGLHPNVEMNQYLMARGFGKLDDPNLISQLALFVRDHVHFRSLLIRCEPEHRRNMYDAMIPYLQFRAKPLDVYLAEAGQDAAARQLPIQTRDGKLLPFKSPDIQTAQKAVENVAAQGFLTLVCRKCTREERFGGADPGEAIRQAREAGWTYNELRGDGQEICPTCPAVRPKTT